MSKFLFFQILLTATPAFFCINLLHSPGSFAAENFVSETEEATAQTAELPLAELAIAPIKTQIDPALIPEINADIQLHKQQKSEHISLLFNSEKLAAVARSNNLEPANTATEELGKSQVAIAPIPTQTKPASIPEIPATIS